MSSVQASALLDSTNACGMETAMTARYSVARISVILLVVGLLPSLTWGWLAPYEHRKLITLSAGTGAGTEYQVRITVGESSLATGADVHVESHAQNFPNDVRFTDNDENTELGHWLEKTEGTAPDRTATFWVKVTDDLGSSQQIFLYYGEAAGTSGSDGDATFIFFDDFDDGSIDGAKWTMGGTMTEAGGVVYGAVSAGSTPPPGDYLFGKTQIPIETRTLIRIRNHSTGSSARPGVLTVPGNPYSRRGFGWQDYQDSRRYTDTYVTSVTQVQDGIYNTGWYDLETVWRSGAVDFYVNGGLLITHTTQIPSTSDVLYGQVEGDADYDLFYSRKYVSSEPAFSSADAEENFGGVMMANETVVDITATAAKMVGNLSAGSGPITVTCFWSTVEGTDDPATWSTNNDLGVTVIGYATNSVGGLTAGTRYYYRFYAINDVGDEDWANSADLFSTVGAPTVTNHGATGIGQTTATLHGELIAGNPDPYVWFCWGTVNAGTNSGKFAWEKQYYVGQPGLTTFDADLTGLLANQQYFFRAVASNVHGEVWSAFTTNFTTDPPDVTIDNVALSEGASGENPVATFTVSLSATSAVAVTVDWETADNTATIVDNDYQSGSDTLNIPGGDLSGTMAVTVNGDDKYEANETFYVNLTGSSGGNITDSQGVGTINNDDYTFYVRGDGNGSDSYGGGSWSDAFATLQKAVDTVPLAHTCVINVQASTGGQTYDVVSKSYGWSQYTWVGFELQGGWADVDGTPVQTGFSTIVDGDGTIDERGINLYDGYHGFPKHLTVNRFVITNVTVGIRMVCDVSRDNAGLYCMVNNGLIRSQSHGICLDYPKPYGAASWGDPSRVVLENSDIVAGLGGSGCGVYIRGSWLGSRIVGTGGGVSTVTTLADTNGVHFSALNNETSYAHFSNVVVYACGQNGIYLDNRRDASTWYRVQGTLENCTIADNGADGVRAISWTSSSYVNAKDCIFAGNGGEGIRIENANMSCTESYSVFFNDGIEVNGAPQALSGTSSSDSPLLFGSGTKPSPWYLIGNILSSAYESASDGEHRGAYQDLMIPTSTVIMLR